jgi:hypothetical protein
MEFVDEFADWEKDLLKNVYEYNGVACRRSISVSIAQSLVNRYEASVKSMTPQGDLSLFLAC